MTIDEKVLEIEVKDAEKKLFKIDEVSKIIGVHQQTLRNWEKKKLVKPLRAGSIRVYTYENIELCRQIKKYSGKGIHLKGIKELISAIN